MKEKKQKWTQYNEALDRVGGDEAFLEQLLEIYIKDVMQRLDSLRRALAEKDFRLIRHQAHTLKGASANLSLESLRKISFAMESAGDNGDLDMARATLQQFTVEFMGLLVPEELTRDSLGSRISTQEEKHDRHSSDH